MRPPRGGESGAFGDRALPAGGESGALGDRALPCGDESTVEIICVDDGSTDGSGEILDEYVDRSEKCEVRSEKLDGENSETTHYSLLTTHFKIIHQQNAGVSAARNAGMDAATGDYVVFVDADDAVVPWFFETLREAIETEPGCDIYMFGAQSVKDLSATLPERCDLRVEGLKLTDTLSVRRAYERVYGVLLAWGACHRRESLSDIRFKPLSNGEDMLFGFECLCRARQIGFLNQALYRYRMPREGSANNPTLKNVRSCCEYIGEYWKIAETWQHHSDVADVERRKMRTDIVWGVYPLVRRIPVSDRSDGVRLFVAALRRLLCLNDGLVFAVWDRFWIRMTCRYGNLKFFHCAVYVPFRGRVLLQRLPIVRALKHLIRGI